MAFLDGVSFSTTIQLKLYGFSIHSQESINPFSIGLHTANPRRIILTFIFRFTGVITNVVDFQLPGHFFSKWFFFLQVLQVFPQAGQTSFFMTCFLSQKWQSCMFWLGFCLELELVVWVLILLMLAVGVISFICPWAISWALQMSISLFRGRFSCSLIKRVFRALSVMVNITLSLISRSVNSPKLQFLAFVLSSATKWSMGVDRGVVQNW